ncbi:MAG TPA: c-type cytochrome [Methylophilaceae bacterium]|jgi:cytochrome c5
MSEHQEHGSNPSMTYLYIAYIGLAAIIIAVLHNALMPEVAAACSLTQMIAGALVLLVSLRILTSPRASSMSYLYLFLFLLAVIIFSVISNAIMPATVSDNSESAVADRIKPVAQVVIAPPMAAPGQGKSGEQVVTGLCAACHAVGAMGSPKIGDKAAWGPRIAQGYQTLIQHAINGIRMMPARGGDASLSDEEVAGAVAYMANKAGANFKAPPSK